MCAIAGFLDLRLDAQKKENLLRRMAAVQAHRGPDGEGFFTDGNVGLAHRRLSIVGGPGGEQPLFNEDRSIAVVANGEFFDHVEQRRMLEARGHQFRTNSDCEILVHLWEDHGEEMLGRLKGQFAFALWDRKRSILFLARDRVGIVPLHWTCVGGQFLFSSEVKGLLVSGVVPIEADFRGIDHVFSFIGQPSERTCFRGISSLLPGHSLTLRPGRVTGVQPRQYWDLEFPDMGQEYDPGRRVVVEEFGSRLQEAVDERLRADVPVGAYLSGGIDSSTVLRLAGNSKGGGSVPSFTIEIPTPGLNELEGAREVAALSSSKQHVVTCSANVIGEVYPSLIKACDAPVMDTSCAALFCLAGQVNNHGYKAVLTGEGADEGLAGYPWFKVNRLISLLDRGRMRPSNLIRRVVGKMSGRKVSWKESSKYQNQLGSSNATADVYSLLQRGRSTLYSGEMWRSLGDYSPLEDIKINTEKMKRWHPLNQSLYLGYKTILPGLLLNQKGDRPAMSHSVETRYPFLDEEVIDFCARLHPKWKLRGLTRDKHVLREFASDLLPPAITNRRKHMFRAPFASTFFASPPEYVRQLMSNESLAKTGYFSIPNIRELCREYERAPGSWGCKPSITRRSIDMALTSAMATQLWHHLYLGGNLCDLPTWSPRLLPKAQSEISPLRAVTQ